MGDLPQFQSLWKNELLRGEVLGVVARCNVFALSRQCLYCSICTGGWTRDILPGIPNPFVCSRGHTFVLVLLGVKQPQESLFRCYPSCFWTSISYWSGNHYVGLTGCPVSPKNSPIFPISPMVGLRAYTIRFFFSCPHVFWGWNIDFFLDCYSPSH